MSSPLPPGRNTAGMVGKGAVRRELPPIVGSCGLSTWFGGGAHLAQDAFSFTDTAVHGFSLLFDSLPDSSAEQAVLGAEASDRAITVTLNHGGHLGALCLRATDGQATFQVTAQLSTSRSRRVLISARPREAGAAVYELQAWAAAPGTPVSTEVQTSGDLLHVGPPPGQFTLAGIRRDGVLASSFHGRLADVAVLETALDNSDAMRLAAGSENPTGLTYDALGSPSSEMLDRLARDIVRLKEWHTKPIMDRNDVEDASGLLSRWLFDKHPVLVDVCRLLGIQLWLIVSSDRDVAYTQLLAALDPLLYVHGPSQGPFGFTWKTLGAWRSERLFYARGNSVSTEQFIKFVRNKLGGGHFDETTRTRWQRDLLELARSFLIGGSDALAFQMQALVDSVLQTIAAIRLESLIS